MEYYKENEAVRRRRAELIRQVVLFVAVVALMFYGATAIGNFYRRQNLTILKQSARRAAVECYSVEGIYPPDID